MRFQPLCALWVSGEAQASGPGGVITKDQPQTAPVVSVARRCVVASTSRRIPREQDDWIVLLPRGATRGNGRLSLSSTGSFLTAFTQHRFLQTVFSRPPQVSTMEAKSQRPKDRDGAILALNATIEVLNLAKEISSITPAKAAFGAVSVLLAMLKVHLVFCNHLFQTHAYPGLND